MFSVSQAWLSPSGFNILLEAKNNTKTRGHLNSRYPDHIALLWPTNPHLNSSTIHL